MRIQNVKKQLTAACRCSCSRLALNVYMLGEMLAEDREFQSGAAVREQEFLRLLTLYLAGEPVAEALDCLREQVTERMKLLTACNDYFLVYKHVFDRLEGRFNPDYASHYPDMDNDEKRLQWLMRYITASDEAVTVNCRIQMVLGQLPIRLTKQKFFSMVRKALELYKGSESKSLDDMMYVLYSDGLLNRTPGTDDLNPELKERLQRFCQEDYKNMTAKTCQELVQNLEQTGEMLSGEVDRASLLMDLINDLYVLVLAGPQEVSYIPEETSARQVLASVLACLRWEGEFDERLLEPLEGSQETCFEEWEACAAPPELLEENCVQDPMAELLRRISLLLSTSSFASLDRIDREPRTVGEEELDRVCGEFESRFQAAWDQQPRLAVRGAMAQILSSLPVCFGTLEEVKQYIKGCLDSCADETEKSVSLDLIRQTAELEELDIL